MSENHISTRLRDTEVIFLNLLRKEFLDNVKNANVISDVEDAMLPNMEYFLNMSKHQMMHFMIQYCYAKKAKFIPLLVDMAKQGIPDIETYQNIHGDIDMLEDSKELLEQNYLSMYSAASPTTKEDYERMMQEFKEEEKKNKIKRQTQTAD